jgi:pimeloyl-ACP methyl ester carboxylesterase
MPLEVTHHRMTANDLDQHYVIAGEGPPVVLLHGFPEFWYAWRHQIPALAAHYTVVAPDLRGYGYTEKPYTGYDKRTMAADIRALMAGLGYDRAAIVGHDRGARVGLRLAKDHPDFVERLAVLDNVPTRVVFEMMNGTLAKGQWWFLFNAVPNLAEALLVGREEIWLRHFYTEWSHDPDAITLEDFAEYLRAYRQPGAVMGFCNDYRAGSEDVAQDTEDQDVKLGCPVLALWGADFEWVGRAYDVAGIWADMAPDLRTVEIPDCRHLPHEEQPDQVNGHLLRFLAGG